MGVFVNSIIRYNLQLSFILYKTKNLRCRPQVLPGNNDERGEISVFINNIDAVDENACGNEYQHGKYGGWNTREACPKVGEQHGKKQADDCEKY